MICERCQKEHDGTFGSGRFCSKQCANTRVFSEETKLSKKTKMIAYFTNLKENDPIKYAKYCEKQRTNGLLSSVEQGKKMRAYYDTKPWNELGKDGKRRRVIDEQEKHCSHCGLSEWRGQPITLELEHKDGNHMNDERDNLEAVCPNCHSLTDTWRGKNQGNSKQGKISDNILIEALKATETIRQALIVVGLSPRGNNYVRAKRLLDKM